MKNIISHQTIMWVWLGLLLTVGSTLGVLQFTHFAPQQEQLLVDKNNQIRVKETEKESLNLDHVVLVKNTERLQDELVQLDKELANTEGFIK